MRDRRVDALFLAADGCDLRLDGAVYPSEWEARRAFRWAWHSFQGAFEGFATEGAHCPKEVAVRALEVSRAKLRDKLATWDMAQ
jgi:hypothetical protein